MEVQRVAVGSGWAESRAQWAVSPPVLGVPWEDHVPSFCAVCVCWPSVLFAGTLLVVALASVLLGPQ